MVDMEGEVRTMQMVQRMNLYGQQAQQPQQPQQQQIGTPTFSVHDAGPSGLLPGSAHLNLGYEDGASVLDIAKYVLSYLGVTREPAPGDVLLHAKESDSGRPDTPDTDDLESASAETPPPSATPEPPSAVPPPPPTPSEEDFEHIKLISNGAYGAVYLVRHKA